MFITIKENTAPCDTPVSVLLFTDLWVPTFNNAKAPSVNQLAHFAITIAITTQ